MSRTEYLWFNTPERFQIINITDKVQEIVAKSKINVTERQEKEKGYC